MITNTRQIAGEWTLPLKLENKFIIWISKLYKIETSAYSICKHSMFKHSMQQGNKKCKVKFTEKQTIHRISSMIYKLMATSVSL